MPRFIEYFSIIGIKNNEQLFDVGTKLNPDTLLMIPSTKWKDFDFPPGLSNFCLPDGWYVRSKAVRPLFYSNVLTNVDGSKCFAATLICYERLNSKEIYIPKALTLISKFPYFKCYRHMLGLIFLSLCGAIPHDSSFSCENFISNIIYNDYSPDPGSPKFTITLLENSLTVYPPLSSTIPLTDDNVATLLRLVGINNLVLLYSAILLDNKIAFVSKSYNYLYKCTQGLISLIYPMKWSYIFIPVLPTNLIDVINAPTPYILGVHSSCEIDTEDLTDTLIMNLDINTLIQDESHKIPAFPSPYLEDILQHLVILVRTDLGIIDQLYPNEPCNCDYILDKVIRACFFYSLLKLLAGYRPCTTYARLVPYPVMKFHSDLFISRLSIEKIEFYHKFFNTTSFNSFINEKGSTYRYSDYFDDIINDFGYKSIDSLDLQLKIIEKISKQFLMNEPDSNDSSSCSLPPFPQWSSVNFDQINIRSMSTESITVTDTSVSGANSTTDSSNVPLNLDLFHHEMVFYIGHRRKAMIVECVALIFSNKISNALKLIHAVMESLSSVACRFALINELIKYKTKDRTLLTTAQLSLVARLLNAIMQNDKSKTCYSSAVQILKLCCNYFQIVSDTREFLYLFLQSHTVWKDLGFWLNYYFFETQSYLVSLHNKKQRTSLTEDQDAKENFETVYHPELFTTIEALKVSTNVMSDFAKASPFEKKEIEQSEVSFLYSHTIDMLYKMAYMLIELETPKQLNRENTRKEPTEEVIQKFKTDKLSEVSTFMNKFLTNVNMYVSLKNEMMGSLQELIKNILESQYEEVQTIRNIVKKNQLIESSEKLKPTLIYESEQIVTRIIGYIFYKKPEDEFDYDPLGSLSLLPAEGYLHITNKRIVFIGRSIDPFLSDFVVHLSIPNKSLLKFKIIDSGSFEFDDKYKLMALIQIKTKYCLSIQFGVSESASQNILDHVKKALKTTVFESPKVLRAAQKKTTDSSGHIKARDSVCFKDSGPDLSSEPNKTGVSNKKAKPGTMLKKFGQFSTLRGTKSPQLAHEMAFSPCLDRDNNSKCVSYNEFNRMGMCGESEKSKTNWRVSQLNKSRRITPTLSECFLVPVYLSDESLFSALKMYRHKRLPVGTYITYSRTESFELNPRIYIILRSEAPVKNISLASSQKTNVPTSKTGQESIHLYLSVANTQEISRRKFIKEDFTFKNLAILYDQNDCIKKLNQCELDFWSPSHFYVFYDRNFTRTSSAEKICCAPVENITLSDIKKAFNTFQRAFYPTNSKDKKNKNFLEIIDESHWLSIVNRCICVATCGEFLADVANSSVLYSFSNGCDLTSVLASLTQMLIDPYYRTFQGFQKLIEKDWFEYGYNFFSKNFVDFAPVFILFLDCIFQILMQFPFAFEFNTYFLSFLAFHNFSTKYDNFMVGDDTVEAVATEDMAESNATLDDANFDRTSISTSPHGYDSCSILPLGENITNERSIFKPIQTYIECSTIFHNMYYDGNFKGTIYPACQVSSLEIWPFYYVNNFQIPCMYNLETFDEAVINLVLNDVGEMKSKTTNAQSVNDLIISNEAITTYKYTGIGTPYVVDSISWYLFEIGRLNDELDRYSQPMNQFLLSDKTEHFTTYFLLSPQRFVEFNYLRGMCYNITEPPKHIKNDPEKLDKNLHALTKLEGFSSTICCVCGIPISMYSEAVNCTKCRRSLHSICQPFSYMICDSGVHGSEQLTLTVVEEQSDSGYRIFEDDTYLRGKLYSKKRYKNSWAPLFYAFNKKSHTFNVYLSKEFNTLPHKTYHVSQLSSIFEVKTMPSSTPREMLFSAGAFEIRIKRKAHVFLTPTKPEAGTWVRTLSKYISV